MPEAPTDHEFLTAEEAAAYLRVSQHTIWRWCKQGRLPAFRIGREWRILRSGLDELIEALVAANAEERESKGAEEQGSGGAREQRSSTSSN